MRRVSVLVVIVLFFFSMFGCSPLPKEYEAGLLKFPKDFAPHRDYSTEWWYQTGVLNDGRFGYEITLFRMYDPQGEHWPRIFGQPVGELWLVHAMVNDYESGKRYFKEWLILPPLIFFGSGVGTCSQGFCMRYSSQSLYIEWSGGLDDITLIYGDGNLELHLELSPRKMPVAHGDGKVPMVSGESFYYSITDIDVKGEMKFDGEWHEVHGSTWIDQQWGDFDAKPWEWYSIRFENGAQIMLYSFPGRNVGFGTIVFPDGSVKSLSLEDFTMGFEETAIDSQGDVVRIPYPGTVDIPEYGIHLEIRAKAKDQFNRSVYTPEYWEGLCEVEGTFGGKSVRGWAFYETWR